MDNFSKNDNKFHIDTSFTDELAQEKPVPEKTTIGKEIVEWLEILCGAIVVVILVFSFFFRVATIDGESMMNTLKNQDKVIITNFNYTPKRGDIVVVSRNAHNSVAEQSISEEPIIKRVIAVGGETVDIDFESGTVYVDGVALKEDYLGSPTHRKFDVEFPLYIPEGCVFLLGDNRDDSLDSRSSRIGNGGIVDSRYILGHAIYRFLPFQTAGKI